MERSKDHEEVVDEILHRAVGEYVDPDGIFRQKLIKKLAGQYPEDIVVKFGVDTTRPDIHLGHAVVLRKLRALQDIGCKIIFLIGDFTTQIGDPTGKSKVRPEISQAEIEQNLKTYLDQVGKILRVERDGEGNILHTPLFSWIRNSDWFVGVTDIAVDPTKSVSLGLNGKDGAMQVDIPSNSFLGKAAVFESTRMQKNQLHQDEVNGITLINFLSVLRRITHAQLIERDMFQERLQSGDSLFMHEMMYPVIQALDSVMIARIYGSCDIELGGTDQTFNLLMGRKVMEMSGIPPQAVMSLKLLVGTDGTEKMSKSLDNYIGVTDTANSMYGKVMSLPDKVMQEYFELATYTNIDDFQDLPSVIEKGKKNPRDVKMLLARQIVEIYHGHDAAKKAEEFFIDTFQKREIPEDIPSISVKKGSLLSDILTEHEIVSSKSEFRRMIDAGAIKINGEEKVSDPFVAMQTDSTIRVGKHQFIRITVL